MMAGFIKLYRGWRDCDAFKDEPASQREAWIWLLENAAWKDCQRRDAQGSIITVKRGQLHTSIRTLAGAWKWSRGKVERFLGDLKTCHMTGHEAGHGGLLITVCNYDKYQANEPSVEPSVEPSAGPSAGHTKEREEKKEDKKGAYAFAGRVVRLNQRDFDTWQSTFHAIPDLRAELTSLDSWLSDEPEARRKKWFNIVSGALNKKHQQLAAPTKASELEVSWP